MYLGIDLHKWYAQVAVRDESGDLIEEVRVKNTNLDELAQRYAGGEAVIEATSNYYHIYNTLSEHLDVTVGHPSKLDAIAQSDKKTDRRDAQELARLLYLGSVPESYVPPQEIHECRALVRGRNSLLETRTKYANKIHGLLADVGIIKEIKPVSAKGREFLEELSLEDPWQALLESYLTMIDSLTQQKQLLDEKIKTRAEAYKETQLMMTAHGVGPLTALAVYAEVGEIERFDEHKQVVSYMGMNPTIRESGDSRIEGGISKKGPAHVRWLLAQAVQSARRTQNEQYLTQFYERLAKDKHWKTALVATARKLLVSLYHMWKNGEEYNPRGVSS